MRFWPVVRVVGAGLLALGWAVAAYVNSGRGQPSHWGVALALAPLVLVAAVALWRLQKRWLGAVGFVLVVGGLIWLWPLLLGRVATVYFVEHVGVEIFLAALFGRTLFGPGESLVTQLARRVHGGELSVPQQSYTRNVTRAWTLFFSMMALTSTVLFIWAPLSVWSTFATLLSGPLTGAMFAGEMLVRRKVLREEKTATFSEALRVWRSYGSESDR